ncbi:MAG: sugar transferase [Anaerolineales bacterium]|nr:sugar transferase [Anaerolineales bacterium]
MFKRAGLSLILLLGDLATLMLALMAASWLRPQLEFGKPIPVENVLLPGPVYGLVLFIWATGFILLNVYQLQKNLRPLDEIQRLIAAHAATTLAFAGALYFSFRDVSRLQVLYFALIGLFFLLAYRLTFRLFLRFFGQNRYGARRVLIVGAGRAGHQIGQMVIQNGWTGLKLVGFMDDNSQADTLGYPHFGPLDRCVEIVQEQRVNEIIFTLPRYAHDKLANLVAALDTLKVNVRVMPNFMDLVFLRSEVEDLGGMPLVTLREPALDPLQRLTKRIFDLIVSGIALILALPFMGIIALFIKFDSPGPVIFKQQRAGENSQPFDMYKFRTMVHDAESRHRELIQLAAGGQPVHKFYDDPRVTKFGRFLRCTSLDELPQLINVLKGEMSLVGPRPELPWLVDKYEPWQRKRFEVPQGLTGWWQVNGRSDKLMHLHTDEDLYYIKHYSLWLDIQILWRTVKAVIDRRGAF